MDNQFILQAKRGINGGSVFVKWNTETKRYYVGNTASTAVSNTNGLNMYGVTNKEVRQTARLLANRGYTEFNPTWGNGIDTYGDIREAGL